MLLFICLAENKLTHFWRQKPLTGLFLFSCSSRESNISVLYLSGNDVLQPKKKILFKQCLLYCVVCKQLCVQGSQMIGSSFGCVWHLFVLEKHLSCMEICERVWLCAEWEESFSSQILLLSVAFICSSWHPSLSLLKQAKPESEIILLELSQHVAYFFPNWILHSTI